MDETLASTQDRQNGSSRLAEGRRVALVATVMTLLLVVAKGLIGYLWNSPALRADAVHSGADALAIFASWLGLRLADRSPTNRFPFGLYRAETLAALVVSVVILTAGIGLLTETVPGLVRGGEILHHSWQVLLIALISAILSSGIFLWEKRVGERLNSQSLLANADESRIDIITSLAVFLGAGATYLGIHRAELIVALGLSLLIIWLGLKHGRIAVYALLDASLSPDLETRALAIADGVPGVLAVEQVRLRRAGPFCFGIAHIRVRKTLDVARAHEVAHEVVRAVRKTIPQIEMLTVHLEPFHPEQQRVMVPADDNRLEAAVSEHFGRAKFFVFVTVSTDGIGPKEWLENSFRNKPARAGLSVIKEMLKNQHIDAVLTREIGEIAFHTLRDHYVDIYAVPPATIDEALAFFTQKKLAILPKPTHASEAAGRPKTPDQASSRSQFQSEQMEMDQPD